MRNKEWIMYKNKWIDIGFDESYPICVSNFEWILDNLKSMNSRNIFIPFWVRPQFMPFGLLNLIEVFIFQMLLILFYLPCHFIQLEVVRFPVVNYPDYVFQWRTEVWVWSQHVTDEILHFLRTPSWVSHCSIHNT